MTRTPGPASGASLSVTWDVTGAGVTLPASVSVTRGIRGPGATSGLRRRHYQLTPQHPLQQQQQLQLQQQQQLQQQLLQQLQQQH